MYNRASYRRGDIPMARDGLTPEEADTLKQIARQMAALDASSEKVAVRLRAYAAEWHIPVREEQVLRFAAEATASQADAPEGSSSRSAAALVRRSERDRRSRERRSNNRRTMRRRHNG